MPERHEPISLGSPRFITVDSGTFRVTEAWFPPGMTLDAHTHDRAIFAVMLDGCFTTAIAGRRLDCRQHTCWVEPIAEKHANFGGTAGARVLAMQPDPTAQHHLEPFERLLDQVSYLRDPIVALDARKLAAEVTRPDALTPLVMDSLVVVMLARAARLGTRDAGPRAPDWLRRTHDVLHDRFREGVTLTDLASCADVTTWHLARTFRRHYGTSIGEYMRALRVNWALEQLALTRTPISCVALDAGFADQSHLTRACRAATGLAPSAYRRAMQS
jgi:AraC family transcriptional regulator